jgi:fucose permease
MTELAVIGATALWLMYSWLLSAIVASYLSDRKGYGEKLGLAFGMLLSVVGVVIWLLWPAKSDSKWKRIGPIGRGKSDRKAVAPSSES